MHILVIGAAGMIGRKLVERLLARRAHRRQGDRAPDAARRRRAAGAAGASVRVATRRRRLSVPGEAATLVADAPDVIFHLAAIVSGEAETDFDKGYRINLDGTRFLFEAIRAGAAIAALVFTCSIAVFGAPFPDAIRDEFHLDAADLLRHAEGDRRTAARRLYAARLPRRHRHPAADASACGRASRTRRRRASSPASSASRSPARRRCCRWRTRCARHASPRAAVGFLVHAAELDAREARPAPGLTMPGVCCTVAEQIEALRRVAGDKVVARIRREPDPVSRKDRRRLALPLRRAAASAGFRAKRISTRSSARSARAATSPCPPFRSRLPSRSKR